MKGLCPICQVQVIDEVEYSEFEMCYKCYLHLKKNEETIDKIEKELLEETE